MILSPFFAATDSGIKVTGWMNRLLVLAEFSFLALAGLSAYREAGGHMTFSDITMLAVLYFAISIANNVLRVVWRLLFVLYYGTNDPNQILSIVERREQNLVERKVGAIRRTAQRNQHDAIVGSVKRANVNNDAIDYQKGVWH